MNSISRLLLIAGLTTGLALIGCEEGGTDTDAAGAQHGHTDGDSHDHDGAGHGEEQPGHDHDGADGDDHDDHELQPLGDVALGDMTVTALQGHGSAAAGKELHLVVVLPEEAAGSTVRAWIGTDDRYASVVARGEFSAEQGGHELHAVAPDPLPENAAWWIEVELSDGTTHVGSVPVR